MEEKKSIKVSLGTVICIIIIILLFLLLIGMWYYYNYSSKGNNNLKTIDIQDVAENMVKNNEVETNAEKNDIKDETKILEKWDIIMQIESKAIEAFNKYDNSRTATEIYAPEIEFTKNSDTITSKFYVRPIWEETSSLDIYEINLTLTYNNDKYTLSTYNIKLIDNDTEILEKWDIIMQIESKTIEAFNKYDNSRTATKIYAPEIEFTKNSDTITSKFYVRPIWEETSSLDIYEINLTLTYNNDKYTLSTYNIDSL